MSLINPRDILKAPKFLLETHSLDGNSVIMWEKHKSALSAVIKIVSIKSDPERLSPDRQAITVSKNEQSLSSAHLSDQGKKVIYLLFV